MRTVLALFLALCVTSIAYPQTAAPSGDVSSAGSGQKSTEATQGDAAQSVASPSLQKPLIHIVPFVDPASAPPTRTFAIPGAHVTYFGGPIISNVHVIQVLYGAGAYLPNVSSTTRPSMATFFADVTQSSYFDLLNEYTTSGVVAGDGGPSSNQTLGHGFFDGQFAITPSAANNGPTITDAQIQAELLSQVAAGHLPAPVFDLAGNTNTLYMIYFPPGKSISAGGIGSCVRGGFCGYHNSTTGTFASKRLYYGVLPDTQPPGGCSVGCGSTDPFTSTMNVSSHELSEAVTDPDVGPASALARPLAWVDPVNSEIGDICVGQISFVTVAGTSYTVQREFSDFQNDCVSSPAQFQITGGLSVVPGQKFDLPVTLQTANGGNLVSYNGTVHFTSTDPGAILPPDYTFNFADAGSHIFVVSLSTVGNQTITVTDAKSPVLPGNGGFTVIPGGAANLNVAGPSNASTGAAVPFVVTARAGSPNNEIVSSYNGTVHFTSSDAAAVLPADAKLTNGSGIFSVTFNSAGTQTFSAHDTVNNQLFGSATSLVATAPANPTSTVVGAGTNPGTFGQAVSFTASVTQQGAPVTSGQVAFNADGFLVATGIVNASGQATASTGTLSGGKHTIFAEYSGGGAGVPNSSSAPFALQIDPAATTTVATSSISPSNFGDRVIFGAQMSSALNGTNGGTVTFTDNGATFAVLDAPGSSVGFVDTSLPAGSHSIVASYSGNVNFAPSISSAIVQVVNPAPPLNYKIQSDKTSATLLAGQSATFLISTTSVTGFSGSVQFSCNNLPAFTTCTFAPATAFVSTASPLATTTLTVKTTGSHASLTTPPSIGRERGHSLYAGLWSLGPFIFGIILLRRPRSRNQRTPVTMVLMSLVLVGALTSCGGGGSTPPPPPPTPQITPAGTTALVVAATGTPTSGSPGATNPNQQLSISITVQ